MSRDVERVLHAELQSPLYGPAQVRIGAQLRGAAAGVPAQVPERLAQRRQMTADDLWIELPARHRARLPAARRAACILES